MKQELKDFGLSDNEIKVYLTLIKKGPLGPTEIAKTTSFARSYIYEVLASLKEKSIVGTVTKNQKRKYIATSPKHLIELTKQRLEALEKATKELEAIRFTESQNIKVELRTGRFVFRALLNDILIKLKKGDEALFYGIDDDTLIKNDPLIEQRLDQYLAKIVKNGIKERLIVKEGTKIIPEAKTTKYKFLPKKTIGNLAFVTYANRLAIFLWGEPNHLIFIKSKGVADSYKNQFNILWKHAKGK